VNLLQRQWRSGDVLGKTLLALRIGEAHGVVDAEPEVPLRQEVLREVLGQKFLLHQEPDEPPAEHFGHLLESKEVLRIAVAKGVGSTRGLW